MTDDVDFYQLLHVRPDAPTAIIRASYRAMMQALKAHPDLGGDPQQAALINEAYAVLSDAARRAAYDHTRKQTRARKPQRTEHPQPYRAGAPVGAHCLFCHAPSGPLPADRCPHCHSPLQPAEAVARNRAQARRIERMNKTQPLELYTSWPSQPCRGLTEDLSLQGMRFLAPFAAARGQKLQLRSPLCDAVARVVHSARAGDRYRIGVAFITVHFHQSTGGFVHTRA